MNKKERMLKKYYRNEIDSVYHELLSKIKKSMQNSMKDTTYFYRGTNKDADKIAEKLRKDGFDVNLTNHLSIEHKIEVKWLD